MTDLYSLVDFMFLHFGEFIVLVNRYWLIGFSFFLTVVNIIIGLMRIIKK